MRTLSTGGVKSLVNGCVWRNLFKPKRRRSKTRCLWPGGTFWKRNVLPWWNTWLSRRAMTTTPLQTTSSMASAWLAIAQCPQCFLPNWFQLLSQKKICIGIQTKPAKLWGIWRGAAVMMSWIKVCGQKLLRRWTKDGCGVLYHGTNCPRVQQFLVGSPCPNRGKWGLLMT